MIVLSRLPVVLKWLIPWAVLSVRVLMVPLFVIAPRWLDDRRVLWLYVIAFITDYFDGVLARAFNTASSALRKADSSADVVFQLATVSVILRHHPGVFHSCMVALWIFLVTAAGWYALDAIRWRRVAGFHAYSAKLFSVELLVWLIMLLSGGHAGNWLSGLLIYGAFSNLEGIAISWMLTKDCCDVPTAFHVSGINRQRAVSSAVAHECGGDPSGSASVRSSAAPRFPAGRG